MAARESENEAPTIIPLPHKKQENHSILEQGDDLLLFFLTKFW
jgi:hypothetical protein